ncbi:MULTISPECIES: chromate transporter [unclassified Prevotella]|uniref:chromate transporter n=1 Tax=unclassified Prevotella TaxID=2638335 RepID=UPI000CEA0E30|nr:MULTISPECIES: chromate transporter [unclassified Prevotella]MCX4294147.1 chromate transporter [Prevotella sp.]NPD55118.1 chromate transporter [Prevotella sp. PTAC]GAY27078.1 chromate transporter [Prevotella sp. MGM1]
MLLQSFKTFFKIGLFTLGGGYAMIPLIEKEIVDRHRWMAREELMDVIAIAQSCPGVFAINVSTFVGYRLRKTRGAVCTTLGTALPSFVIILLIAMFFRRFQDNAIVAAMFRGIRPAVVALIAVPTFNMARSARISITNCWIPIVSALAIWALGVSPIAVIIIAGTGGWIYGRYICRTKEKDGKHTGTDSPHTDGTHDKTARS